MMAELETSHAVQEAEYEPFLDGNGILTKQLTPERNRTTQTSPGGAPSEEPAADPATTELLERILKMADGYYADDAVRHAMELYFYLVKHYSDTPQAKQATQRLMALGQRYERNGDMHQALGIYERLL